MNDQLAVRPARRSDLRAINRIYNYYVANSTCVWRTNACSGAEREAWYREHGRKMPVLVAEYGGRITGWAALSTFRTAYTAAGTLEDSIYVHHDFLHQGIGSRLLTELIERARREGIRSILANISAEQSASIRLHRKFGFRKVGHFPQVGQKFNQRFDAVFMLLALAEGGLGKRR
jgi:phosphinothricin acetyltransferase